MMASNKKGGKIIEAMLMAEPPPSAPAREDDWLASCPVTPLGKRRNVYFYIVPSGEIVEVTMGQHNWRGILSIFGGQTEWLRVHFKTDAGWSERGGWRRACGRA